MSHLPLRAGDGIAVFAAICVATLSACSFDGEFVVAARNLAPVAVEIDGAEMIVDVAKTESATIVRYQVPNTVFEFRPPTLLSGEETLRAESVVLKEGITTVTFAPASDDVTLSLIVDGLLPADEGIVAWAMVVALDPDAARPPRSDPSRPEAELVVLEQSRTPAGPVLLSSRWWRGSNGRETIVRLDLELDGAWHFGSNPPAMFGDGLPLRVAGSGGSNSADGPRSSLSGVLQDDEVPARVAVVHGIEYALPPIEVLLHP